MKKIIGILVVAVFAMIMFFNTNDMNNSLVNMDLAGLVVMNNANAECGSAPPCYSVCSFTTITHCILTCEMNYIECDNSYPRS